MLDVKHELRILLRFSVGARVLQWKVTDQDLTNLFWIVRFFLPFNRNRLVSGQQLCSG